MAIPMITVDQAREIFTCPITYDLFQDPVREGDGTCGHTFENLHIQQWLADNSTCPLSRQPLVLTQLVPDRQVKAVCDLLDPARIVPLTQEDRQLIHDVAQNFQQRHDGQRVPLAVHQSLMEKVATVAAMAIKTGAQKSRDYYGC